MSSHSNSQLKVAAAFIVCILSGCGTSSHSASSASRHEDPPPVQDILPERVSSLTHTTEEFEKDMREQLAKRGAGAPAETTPPVQPPARPSQARMPSLEWLNDGGSWSMSLLPRQQETLPAPVTQGPAADAQQDRQVASMDLTHTDVMISGPKDEPPALRPEFHSDGWDAKIAQAAREYPHDLTPQLEFQLLQFLKGKDVPQLDSLGMLSGEDRELLSAILDGLTNLRSSARMDANMPLAKRIRPWLDAADRLRLQAGLTIPTIALCSEVKGFGVYTPVASNQFPAGRDHPLVVYCEVENFSSHLDGDGSWATKLMQQMTIYDSAGKVVGSEPKQEVLDQSRNHRHDFFVGRRMILPARLMPGKYSVRVTVQDPLAKRVAEATANVQIVGP